MTCYYCAAAHAEIECPVIRDTGEEPTQERDTKPPIVTPPRLLPDGFQAGGGRVRVEAYGHDKLRIRIEPESTGLDFIVERPHARDLLTALRAMLEGTP